MNIPSTLRAGDTITWTESLADYSAADGWILYLSLRAKDKVPINISTTASGANFLISIPITTTEKYVAGIYAYQAYVLKPATPTEKYTVETGTIEILPNISGAGSQDEFRSDIKQMLDDLTLVLKGRMAQSDLSYSIAGRSMSKMSHTELLQTYSFLKGEYLKEQDAEAIEKGLDSPRRIGIRFEKL